MKFTFKSFKGDRKSSQADDSSSNQPSPQAKRKDQIRRAQKTHRERKEAYTKSLEIEVVQLRAKEAKILRETKVLYAELTALKMILVKNGLQLPTAGLEALEDPGVVENPEGHPFELSIQDAKTKHEHQRIHIQRNVANDHKRRCEPPGADVDKREIAKADPPSNFSHPFSPPTQIPSIAEPNASIGTLGELDLTAIGMDFVLTLESPCLSHHTPPTEDTATGHALTVSATLLHHHPAPPERRLNSDHHPAWQVSATSIERLLQLSNSIPLLDDELTPVQAWDKIRQHPEFVRLEATRLESLKETLLGYVVCYGFGGVIDQGIFDNALLDTFVVGRVF